mmetsp:Transcript_38902/g.87426  ORF Transcript_38902/g.87426 Transcript_38902/m.87426 type:complete len:378 (+) Transcript_38902:73-1206(+)
MGGVCSTPTIEKSVDVEAPKETATTQEELKVTEAAEATKEEAPKEEAPKEDAVAKPTIKVFGCRGLRNANWAWVPGSANISDAYVICKEKKGEELKELFQTKTIPNSLEPIFDEEFDVEYGSDSILEFTVYDRDPLKPDDVLGRAVLNCASLTLGFNGELELADSGNLKAYIKVLVKTPGSDYPPGPATEFKITFEKGKKKALGFEFDKASADVLFVTSIGKTGLVKEYNDNVKASEQMKAGQYIVAVNGVEKDSKAMAGELAKASKLELSIVRPQCFTIAVTKAKKESLGLKLAQSPASAIITAVENGPVMEWIKVHTDKEVKAGDRIVAVNGRRAAGKELMKLLQKDGPLQLVICRPCPPAGIAGFIQQVWDWFF